MTQPITLSATLEDPTPNATGLIKVRFTTPDRTVFAWVPEEAIRRDPRPTDGGGTLSDTLTAGSWVASALGLLIALLPWWFQ